MRVWTGRCGVERLLCDEDGATAIEYGLIAGLIFIAIVASLQNLGSIVLGLYAVANAVNEAM